MLELIRDTFFGQLIYLASSRKRMQFPEEKADFIVPEQYRLGYKEAQQKRNTSPQEGAEKSYFAQERKSTHPRGSPLQTPGGDVFVNAHHDAQSIRDAEGQTPGVARTPGATSGAAPPLGSDREPPSRQSSDRTLDEGRRTSGAQSGDEEKNQKNLPNAHEDDAEGRDPYIVDWYGPDDPQNPLNWSQPKKAFVTSLLCYLTFSVYAGSSIVTPGLEDFAAKHQVGVVVATLSLTLYVLGYGIGPMFLSSLSEIPSIGRNVPYILTLAVFVVLQVPTALISSTAGFFILRFLAGVFGSPPLATGGATISDMFHPKVRAPWIGVWGISCVCGPALGPLIGGFAFDGTNNYAWTIWPILFASGGALLLLIFTLPETSSTNILARRAARLRKLTGNKELRSQGEIIQANMTGKEIAMMTLVRPFLLTILDPMVLLLNLLIGLVYAILYVWLEAFPIVYVEAVYTFNYGEMGLAFLSILVGAVLAFAAFLWYCKVRLEPMFDRKGGRLDPEDRLEPALVSLIFLPICLFGFGWTATASIHWIVPTIFAGMFSIGTFGAFQAVLNFLADAYPDYVASVLASNDLFRSIMGAAFPLFARAMFNNLQAMNGPTAFPVAWGCTLLGCLTILFVPLPWVFYFYGPQLRKASRYASY
ncbi:putative FLR1-putative H+ antiporter [Microstroma glucosiphilum]|uniref:Putative FLR1-putative H+ antiporter n=1 Tax=Pseudomicrostroma glucosiphilum TaxID=1684307 RepID=A0A316UGF5_9BASI|nr:putative FLR1-putative H+ antiporter [Pseudomicrostroma glucosiphilum]PWN22235.1 putative FLR1-putative H+ antiporter [Pseudomicrostroma glucosiphilum]